MGTVPRLGPAFAQSFARTVVAGSLAARDVAATVARLRGDAPLPLPGDREVLLREPEMAFIEGLEGRRLLSVYARRVRGRRLWVLYRPQGRHLDLVLLTTVPPRDLV